jgi:pSer/pThr/pTyr-binding forkhead associated (FHA) protein
VAELICEACGEAVERGTLICPECGQTKFATRRMETEQVTPQCVLSFPWGDVSLKEEDTLTIGRDPWYSSVASELSHHLDISRQHGSLSYVSGSLVVQDAGSRNGIFVDGKRVEVDFPAVLQYSGSIVFGKSVQVGVELVS